MKENLPIVDEVEIKEAKSARRSAIRSAILRSAREQRHEIVSDLNDYGKHKWKSLGTYFNKYLKASSVKKAYQALGKEPEEKLDEISKFLDSAAPYNKGSASADKVEKFFKKQIESTLHKSEIDEALLEKKRGNLLGFSVKEVPIAKLPVGHGVGSGRLSAGELAKRKANWNRLHPE